MNEKQFVPAMFLPFLLCAAPLKSTAASPAPPELKGAAVGATVAYNSITGTFQYDYEVSNSSESTGRITSFSLDITTTPGVYPPSNGLSNTATGYLSISSDFNAQKLTTQILPVGIAASPARWNCGIDSDGTVTWAQNPLSPAGLAIAPASSLSGYALSSHAPPGIRRFKVEAYVDLTLYFPGIDDLPEDQIAQAVAAQNAARAAAMFSGVTIGPVAPPSLTDVSSLLASLIALKHQAAGLGWLGGDEFVVELDARLDQAAHALARDKKKLARVRLGQFIHDLSKARESRREAEDRRGDRHGKDKHGRRERFVSTTGFQLLAANAELIISKLPNEVEDDDAHERSRHGR